MDSPSEAKKPLVSTKKVVIIGAIIIIALLIAVIVLLTRPQPTVDDIGDGAIPRVAYADDATVVLDEDSLQAAVDEAVENAKNGRIALRYQNDAYSKDGKTFSCYIANDRTNLYDMFIALYSDATLTDQLYLSGLVRPGRGFEELTLDKALPSGDNTVYVALSQVDTDENGQQVITGQVVHTIEFHVE